MDEQHEEARASGALLLSLGILPLRKGHKQEADLLGPNNASRLSNAHAQCILHMHMFQDLGMPGGTLLLRGMLALPRSLLAAVTPRIHNMFSQREGRERVLGKLGPGQLGPGQLGPG